MGHNVDKLQAYQKALAAAAEAATILKRHSFNNDVRLRDQLGASAESVASLMAEGSEQSTDRHFAEYCYRAKGSAREIRTQLIVAAQRGHIADTARAAMDGRYEEIGRMLSGLIERLHRDDPMRSPRLNRKK